MRHNSYVNTLLQQCATTCPTPKQSVCGVYNYGLFSPTHSPTAMPSPVPTISPTNPGDTRHPTAQPTTPSPTEQPTAAPTHSPTTAPTHSPTAIPTEQPTFAFVAEVTIPLKQEFTTELSPSEFLGNVEAVGAFRGSIAALVGVEIENVRVTGATQKTTRHRRRQLAPVSMVIDYSISMEVHDVTAASIERTVAVVAEKMQAPTFTTSLGAAMAKVPSLPAMVASAPVPPTVDQVSYEILRTPKPTPAPTNLVEEASNRGFLDSTGSKIGLGAGIAVVLLAIAYYRYHKKASELDNVSAGHEKVATSEEQGERAEAVEEGLLKDRSGFVLNTQDSALVVSTDDVGVICDVSKVVGSDWGGMGTASASGGRRQQDSIAEGHKQSTSYKHINSQGEIPAFDADTDISREEELCHLYDSKHASDDVADTENSAKSSLKEKGVVVSKNMTMPSAKNSPQTISTATASAAQRPSLPEAGRKNEAGRNMPPKLHLNPLEVTAPEQSVPRDELASPKEARRSDDHSDQAIQRMEEANRDKDHELE